MTFGARTLGYFSSASSNIVNPLTLDGDSYNSLRNGGGSSSSQVDLLNDGTWTGSGTPDDSSTGPASGNWYTPTTASIGNSYWVRFTRTGYTPTGTGFASSSTGWLALSTTRGILSSAPNSGDTVSATFTIEIASDSGGVTIVSTSTVSLNSEKI